MFIYLMENKQNPEIFAENRLPVLTHFSLSGGDKRWNYPIHVQPDEAEIAFVEKGIAYYKIDMHSITANEGDVVVIDSGVMHSVLSSEEDPSSILVIHVSGFQIRDLRPNKILKERNFLVLDAREHLEFFAAVLSELRLLILQKQEDHAVVTQFLTSSLIALVYEMQNNAEKNFPAFHPGIAKDVMYYLNDNYRKSMTLQEIADHFRISTSYLSHEFTKVFSISPINYLINRKICEAKWDLISTELPLEEVAFRVGYTNVNHFKNLFLKRVGISPARYRELYSDELPPGGRQA